MCCSKPLTGYVKFDMEIKISLNQWGRKSRDPGNITGNRHFMFHVTLTAVLEACAGTDDPVCVKRGINLW